MGTYVIDSAFRLQQVNTLAAPIFSNIHPLIGRDFSEVMQILWGPEVGAQCTRVFRHTLETGERYISPTFSEKRHDLGLEQSYEWETQRVTMPDGQHGVVCYFREITERQRAEWALRESEARTRMATESTGVGVWEWNVKTGDVRWYAQTFRIYGIAPTPDGVVPYPTWSATVVPEDLQRQEGTLQEILRTHGKGSGEFQITRCDNGERRHIQAVETVRLNAQGEAEWIVETNLDITERKRAEAALEKAKRDAEAANQAKDEFLSALSHELRTPLKPVMMATSALLDDGVSDPMLREDLEMILRNVQLEVRLIDDLLDVTRIAHGKLVLAKQPCDPHEIVRHALKSCEATLREKRIEVAFRLDAPRANALGDPTRLQQVFWNLLNNAAKFTPSGGRIEIASMESELNRVRVSVCDAGAAHLPALFAAFEQGGLTTTQRFGGLGPGLAICRGAIDLHGGRIWAESDCVGRGATFVVELGTENPS